jgi:hypothetical protein
MFNKPYLGINQKPNILWIRRAELSQIVAQRRCCSGVRDNTEAEGQCRKNLNSHVTRVLTRSVGQTLTLIVFRSDNR